jgi:hypothetical protein
MSRILTECKGDNIMSSRWNELKGKQVKDKVTGFTGICTGRTSWIYGCDQYIITPKADSNKLEEGKWFDDGRIVVIGNGIDIESVQTEVRGGESNHPCNNRR